MSLELSSPYQEMVAVVGVNFRGVSVADRERLLFPGGVAPTLEALKSRHGIIHCVLIATCNRFELVVVGEAAVSSCYEFISERLVGGGSSEISEDAIYIHKNSAAVRHLMRVAASLDSMVRGEPQILGQVKEAYEVARSAGLVGKVLHRLFQYTLSVAKKIRERTGIAGHGISVSYVAVQLAQSIFGELRSTAAVVVGSGRMAELVALHLRAKGCEDITVANRTVAKAAELALRVRGRAIGIEELPEALRNADVVVGSIAIDRPLVEMASLRMMARVKPVFFIDLGVPRNFSPEIALLENVYLYNIDDLSRIAAENQGLRDDAAIDASVLVDYGVHVFEKWLHRLVREPWLADLKSYVASVCHEAFAEAIAAQEALPSTTKSGASDSEAPLGQTAEPWWHGAAAEAARRIAAKLSHVVTTLEGEKDDLTLP